MLCALGALTFLPSLPLRDLWNPDEPRYAEVAREMRETGEWLVPHLNGAIYAEKPPLFFWLSALGQMAGLGFNAGRVVAGLAFAGTLLLTWSLARRLLGDRAGLLAAAVLGTAVFFPWLGRFGVLDVVLAFFVTVAVYGWIRGGPWIVLFYVGMGTAVLVKGPVGIALALMGVLAWRFRGGSGAEAAPPEGCGGPWHLAWGPLLTAAIIAAWLWPACVRGGPAYTDAILWKQNVGRAVGSWSHARPFWYYVPLLSLLFPWVLFLPWAAPWAWRREGLPRAMLLWAGAGFLFFSLVSGKRDRYLTPLFPPFAIVVGAWLGAGVATPLARRAARFANAFFLGAGVGLLLASLLGHGLAKRFQGEVAAALEGLASVPGIATASAFAVALFVLGRRGIRAAREGLLPRSAALLALQVWVFLLAYDLLLVPRIDEFKSPRPVAEELNAWPGEVAAYPAHFSGAYNLYSRRLKIPVLETQDEVLAHLSGEGERLVLTSRESYEHARPGEARSLKETLGGRFTATEMGRVGHREMIFLTNYPPP
ncbi:MAG TPA: glycosyltransferase family 39 protein [Planctomycetota bacterium]|nr:glycosyltransferase family 39 protein [Planctomycetota bacterium]